MLKGVQWFGIVVSSTVMIMTAVPFAYSDTASCQKGGEGEKFECTDLSFEGELSGSECGVIKKFVRSACPAADVIATCTYTMGVSSFVKSSMGFEPGPVNELKNQVNCYRDKNIADEKKLEECRTECQSLQGNFLTTEPKK